MKKLKGFTLLECIIAMALIGLTSMLMVQVYGTVAKMNIDNNMMNNSLERQMQYAEKQLTEVAATINGSTNPDKNAVKIVELSSYGKSGAAGNVGKIKFKQDKAPSSAQFDVAKTSTYDTEIDLYVIGIDTSVADGQAIDDYRSSQVAERYDDNNVRYKFIKPKPHPAGP